MIEQNLYMWEAARQYMSNETTFTTGETYRATSVCDSNCHWYFTVERRTNASVWVSERGEEAVRRAVRNYNGEEYFMPFGTYSMAAHCSAGNVA